MRSLVLVGCSVTHGDTSCKYLSDPEETLAETKIELAQKLEYAKTCSKMSQEHGIPLIMKYCLEMDTYLQFCLRQEQLAETRINCGEAELDKELTDKQRLHVRVNLKISRKLIKLFRQAGKAIQENIHNAKIVSVSRKRFSWWEKYFIIPLLVSTLICLGLLFWCIHCCYKI